jgi:hypothetical protein
MHKFASTDGSKGKCTVCGKTRNTADHRAALADDNIKHHQADRAAAQQPEKVRTWVGWRIADEAISRGGSLAEKLRAAKPDSVRDRTVSLTEDEAAELSAIATDVETAALGTKGAGPVVYSARALRARLG